MATPRAGAPRAVRAPRRGVRWLLSLGLLSACSPSTDIVARESTSLGADASAAGDAGSGELGAPLAVIGSPASGWAFEFVTWPLATPLDEFFAAEGGREVRVSISGADAAALRTLRQLYAGAQYGPANGPLGVRDAQGSEYTIRLLPDSVSN